MKVSFVIPAWNEERLLPSTLVAIHKAAAECRLDHEIIVADDASTDRTAEIAREHGATVVTSGVRQIAGTRNAGARASTGAMLIFVDADTRVTTDTVREAVDAVNTGATSGGAPIRFDGKVPWWTNIFLRPMLVGYRLARLAPGCFLFCTRDAFDAIGGFDETLYAAEEADFSVRLRKQGRFVTVRTPVITSGRKLRAYSARETIGLLPGLAICGRRGLRSRDRLGIWYDERRADPDDTTASG